MMCTLLMFASDGVLSWLRDVFRPPGSGRRASAYRSARLHNMCLHLLRFDLHLYFAVLSSVLLDLSKSKDMGMSKGPLSVPSCVHDWCDQGHQHKLE